MLQSLEPVFLLSTIPLEACLAGGGVLCTAIAAQWRANNKTQESSIAAITKSNINGERSVSLLESVAAQQATVLNKIDAATDRIEGLERKLDTIDRKVSKLPQGGDTHRAANG